MDLKSIVLWRRVKKLLRVIYGFKSHQEVNNFSSKDFLFFIKNFIKYFDQ